MAAAAGTVVVIGTYELALLAAAALGLTFFASPQGQEATREAARAASEALAKVRPKPAPPPEKKPEPEPKRPPQPIPCGGGDCKEKKEPEMCPVCGKLPNPTPGFTPPYVKDDRPPMDRETLPPLTSYTKTTIKPQKGAQVYQRPDKTYVHRDTFHHGQAAELEVYNKSGTQIGTICPHCGAPRKGPAKPPRYLPK